MRCRQLHNHALSGMAALSLALLVSACGSSVERSPSCEIDDEVLPKEWFVGQPGAEPPELSLTRTVTEATFAGDEASAFVGASASTDVTAEITESSLLLHDAHDGEVVSAFVIYRHGTSNCAELYDPNAPIEFQLPSKPEPPWEDQPWFRLDWSRDVEVKGYAFDAASAAGYPDAARYEPLNASPPSFAYDLAAGYLAFDVGAFVAWNDIDEATKGCAFDLPDVAPEAPCPTGQLRLAYELHR